VVVSVDIALHTTVGHTVVNLGPGDQRLDGISAAAYATHLGGSELELIRADRMKKVLDAALVAIGSARKGSSLAAALGSLGAGVSSTSRRRRWRATCNSWPPRTSPTTRRSFPWCRSTPVAARRRTPSTRRPRLRF